MIRSYAPIFLIPAAWVLTFLTVVAPGVDTYWIEHMHYFMVLFLAGFVALSWRSMDGPVLKIWRKIIGYGLIATVAGALSFNLNIFTDLLATVSLGYWFLAPGVGAFLSSTHMQEYSDSFLYIGIVGIFSPLIFISGYLSEDILLQFLGIVLAAFSQTAGIVIAAKMDDNL